MKYWLISDEDVKNIRFALDSAQVVTEQKCDDDGCLCDIGNDPSARHDFIYVDALHSLDSGLHKTDCIPDDFKIKQNPDASL